MPIYQLHNSTVHDGLVVSVIAYTIYVIIMIAFLWGGKTSEFLGGTAVLSVIIGFFSALVTGILALRASDKNHAECGERMV